MTTDTNKKTTIIMSLATTKITSNPISILKDLPSNQPRYKTRKGGKKGGREKEGESNKEGGGSKRVIMKVLEITPILEI